MLKSDRMHFILSLVNKKGSISVTELEKELNVSVMTVRRDLDNLDKEGLLVRTHGGATSVDFIANNHMSYTENKEIHLPEKKQVAKLAAKKILANDIVFLGPGTTIELIVDYITVPNVQIVTSSYSVFKKLVESDNDYDVISIGGKFDKRSNSFSGALSSDMISKLQFTKAFIGINGVHDFSVTTLNIDGGELQSKALSNSQERYIVADKFKFKQNALFDFYTLQKGDTFITNHSLDEETIERYQEVVDFDLSDEN